MELENINHPNFQWFWLNFGLLRDVFGTSTQLLSPWLQSGWYIFFSNILPRTISFVWDIKSVTVQWLFMYNHLSTNILLSKNRQYYPQCSCFHIYLRIKIQPLQDNFYRTKIWKLVIFIEFWGFVFLLRFLIENLSSINSFWYPTINQYFEIRKRWFLFYGYFPSTPTPAQLTRPTPPKIMLHLYHFKILQLSSYQEVILSYQNPIPGIVLRRNILLTIFFQTEISKLDRKHGYFKPHF